MSQLKQKKLQYSPNYASTLPAYDNEKNTEIAR